jgi:ATP-dependent helicase HrpB
MIHLPVDDILPELATALARHRSLVLTAPPGSGKTTRVPPALMESFGGEILVLEPRRLAARVAAGYIASERGERVGDSVGYQVRFEEVLGPKTRLKLLTEGLFVRRLMSDPTLDGVAAVVFDEFHERHLATDVSLALAKRLQATKRHDLKLIVMSATLETAPIAAYLGDCYEAHAEGRRFDVELVHAPRLDTRPLAAQVATAVNNLVRGGLGGDILVFLPGAYEIRAAQAACAGLADRHGLMVVPLYGDLPLEAQHRAVRPATQRKLILSTNVAETSITIDGVTAVVDSGLARIASHDPWSGLPELRVRPVSKASAAQRAGRAGRTRPGICVRLYTQHDHDTRPAFEKPEIERLDLSDTTLQLAAMDVADPLSLSWLTTPPEASLTGAIDLLRRLGALDGQNFVTETGRRMAQLPVHPRQARLVIEAEARGCLELGCAMAAILGERDMRADRGPARVSGPSDLLALVEALEHAEAVRFGADRLRAVGLVAGPARAAVRARDQLLRIMKRNRSIGGSAASEGEEGALKAILTGFPDRVARRRSSNARDPVELNLAGGGSAQLSDASIVRDALWLVAIEAEVRSERGASAPRVLLASRIAPDWLLDLPTSPAVEERELSWNDKAERVEAVTRLRYGQLVLDEAHELDVPLAVATPFLIERALAAGPGRFADLEVIADLKARISFLAGAAPEVGLPSIDDEVIRASLAELCQGKRSFAEARETGLVVALMARLSGEQRRALDKLAPVDIALASGRRLRVVYEPGRPPHVASHLQDFFGTSQGPTLVGGRVPVTLELLAPNRRPVQVTTDLAGFWRTHYPALKRALSRKYPRHDWPDDPLTAKPPPAGGRKRRHQGE